MRDFLAGFSKTLSCPLTPPLSQRGGWGDWKAEVNPPLLPLFQRGRIRLDALSLKPCPAFTFMSFRRANPVSSTGQALQGCFYVFT